MAMQQQSQGNGGQVITLIAVALICFGLGWYVGNNNVGSEGTSPRAGAAAAPSADGGALADSDKLPVGDSPIFGNPDAPVTVVEFTSMQCPFCGRAAGTLKQLVEKYPDDVRLVFKHFPLQMQAQAEPASRATIAAGNQDKFWEMKDLLFENINRYREGNFEDLAVELAGRLDLDIDQFRRDFAAPETAAIVQRDMELGNRLGVRGTPHFFINGEVVNGAQPLEKFSEVVDRQLAKIEELRASGVGAANLYAAAVEANLNTPAAPAAQQERPAAPETEVHMVEVRDTDPVKGASEDQALVTILEFSSFQCPFCARGAETLKQLVEKYPTQVRVVFKHFPLGFQQHSEPASRASVAAQNQGKFWEYYDLLYQNQRRLGEDGIFEELAGQLSLNMSRFRTDFAAPETAEIVRQAQRDGQSAGIRGTPGFLVNGIKVVGAQPLATFENHVRSQVQIAERIKREQNLSGNELYAAIVEHNKANIASAPGAAAAPRPEAAPTPTVVDTSKLQVGDSYTWGPDNAPVTIFEFSSFQCPFCARGAETLGRVKEEYGDQVQIVFKNFPLPFQAQSEPAARASLAAGEQGKFWEMYAELYKHQREFARDGLFEELAGKIGLNMDRFRTDMASERLAAQVEAEAAMGRSVGVRGTPAFFINGENLSGAQPFERFKEVIDRHLEEAQ